MKQIIATWTISFIVLPTLVYGLNRPLLAEETERRPVLPSIDCEVTAGPNKGRRGQRSEDGWCEGDWGGTECRPRSKCQDVKALVAADTNISPVGPAEQLDVPIIVILPPRGSWPHEYCQTGGGFLSVVFQNIGFADESEGSEVTVSFRLSADESQSLTHVRNPLKANAIGDVSFPIPDRCYNPSDCSFKIEWANQPSVFGRCS